MPRYDDTIINNVIENSDIVAIISEHCVLSKKGNRYSGCCPFHSEKTPSFHVDPDKKLYHCFGCGKGGNVIGFIMEMENVDFKRAIEILADKAHITLPKQEMSKDEEERLRRRQKYLHINLDAARYYYSALRGKYGTSGMEYFATKRKLSKEIMEKFRLGYSPLEGNFLIRNLKEKGYTETDLEKAGLIVKSQKGNYYDKFFGRVVFPIQDVNDNIVGFTARILDKDSSPAKYMNSPETEVFKKQDLVFGLNISKKSRRGYIVLVEGNMDVISLHQYGIDNVCATCGTALTINQAKLLRKYTSEIVLLYDSDSAGQEATFRAIPLLRDAGLNVKVLHVHDAKDPDEFINKFGVDEFEKLLLTARGYIEFEIDALSKKYDVNETSDRKKFIEKCLERIKEIKDEVDKDSYLTKLSDAARIDVSILQKKLSGAKDVKLTKKEEVKTETKQERSQASIKKELGEKQLVSILLNNDRILFNKIKKYLVPENMETELLKTLLKDIYDTKEKDDNVDIASLLNHYEEPSMQHDIMNIYTIMKTADENKRRASAEQVLKEMLKKDLEIKIQNINVKFKTASSAEQIEMGKELSELTKQLQLINKRKILEE